MLKHTLIALLLLVVSDVCLVSTQSVTLSFSRELVLKSLAANASTASTVSLTSFASNLTDAMTAAAFVSGVPLNMSAYILNNDVVVVASGWAYGSATSAATLYANANTEMDTLQTSGDIYTIINPLAVEHFSKQPETITSSDICDYTDVSLVDSVTCLRNLSITFLCTSNNASGLSYALCSTLQTDCSLITLTSESSSYISTTTYYFSKTFTVYTADRAKTLTLLSYYASVASVFSVMDIAYILINGVQVYYVGDALATAEVGTSAQCVKHFWYLIFLIIVAPIALILGQRFYYCGRATGKRSAKKVEKDIRAGVHTRDTPWMGYGGGMNPYMAQQWGPQMSAGPPWQMQNQQQMQPPWAGGPHQRQQPQPQQPQQLWSSQYQQQQVQQRQMGQQQQQQWSQQYAGQQWDPNAYYEGQQAGSGQYQYPGQAQQWS